MKDLFDVFSCWEPLLKAREAKGLSNWARLQPLAEKLQGKGVDAISFTCSHPTHANPTRHLLGSVEGNLHFLMGYSNPEFHFAPYHVCVIDPNVSLEEAEEVYTKMSHPSNPALWSKAAFTAGPEGDIEEGKPAPQGKRKEDKAEDTKGQEETVEAKSPTGSYTCSPSEGLVYGNHNDHVYRWDMVKDSFFSYFNPEVTEVMNNAAVSKSMDTLVFRTTVPEEVRTAADVFKGNGFDDDVWDLVKSKAKKPGSILHLEASTGEAVYGVMGTSSVDFYTRAGEPAEIQVFDRSYNSFDLTKEGNVPPAALYNFVTKSFNVNTELLDEVLG